MCLQNFRQVHVNPMLTVWETMLCVPVMVTVLVDMVIILLVHIVVSSSDVTIVECQLDYLWRSIQIWWHELFQPTSMDAFEFEYDFVYIRVFTYILSCQNDICSFRAVNVGLNSEF